MKFAHRRRVGVLAPRSAFAGADFAVGGAASGALLFGHGRLYRHCRGSDPAKAAMAEAYDQPIYAVRLRPHLLAQPRGQARSADRSHQHGDLRHQLRFFSSAPGRSSASSDWMRWRSGLRSNSSPAPPAPTKTCASRRAGCSSTRFPCAAGPKFRFNPFLVRIDRSEHEEYGVERLALSRMATAWSAAFWGRIRRRRSCDLQHALAQAAEEPDLS
ncbi:MAG: hypothetical protein U1E19_10080 [Rhodoblastus sp.]